MMKKLLILMGITGAFVLATGHMSYSQSLIKKLKKKAEEKLIEKAFGEEKSSQQENEQRNYETDENSYNPNSSLRNTRGSGVNTTPPDVNANITDAGKKFEDKEYSQSRYAIRQAIIGIEMEMGQQVLKDLPESVNGLEVNSEFDRVVSNSMGLVGLTIERVYQGNDQELKISIGNDAAMLAAANMYMNTATYETSTDQNQKQVDFKGHKSILEYDDYEGYTLSVPFGQSSVMVINGINFSDEDEIMKAAEHFDIEKIKNQLGEK